MAGAGLMLKFVSALSGAHYKFASPHKSMQDYTRSHIKHSPIVKLSTACPQPSADIERCVDGGILTLYLVSDAPPSL